MKYANKKGNRAGCFGCPCRSPWSSSWSPSRAPGWGCRGVALVAVLVGRCRRPWSGDGNKKRTARGLSFSVGRPGRRGCFGFPVRVPWSGGVLVGRRPGRGRFLFIVRQKARFGVSTPSGCSYGQRPRNSAGAVSVGRVYFAGVAGLFAGLPCFAGLFFLRCSSRSTLRCSARAFFASWSRVYAEIV